MGECSPQNNARKSTSCGARSAGKALCCASRSGKLVHGPFPPGSGLLRNVAHAPRSELEQPLSLFNSASGTSFSTDSHRRLFRVSDVAFQVRGAACFEFDALVPPILSILFRRVACPHPCAPAGTMSKRPLNLCRSALGTSHCSRPRTDSQSASIAGPPGPVCSVLQRGTGILSRQKFVYIICVLVRTCTAAAPQRQPARAHVRV